MHCCRTQQESSHSYEFTNIKTCIFTVCIGNVNNISSKQIPEDGVFFHNIEGRKTPINLLSKLSNLKQYSNQDITILTDNQEDKAWITGMLKGNNATRTQDTTQFPVKYIVVDTLENFEGLESPVILFIIPRSWGSGYIGSLKYRLCVVTRAISRLEFLLPSDDLQRQEEFAELKRAFSFSVSVLTVTLYFCLNMRKVYTGVTMYYRHGSMYGRCTLV